MHKIKVICRIIVITYYITPIYYNDMISQSFLSSAFLFNISQNYEIRAYIIVKLTIDPASKKILTFLKLKKIFIGSSNYNNLKHFTIGN